MRTIANPTLAPSQFSHQALIFYSGDRQNTAAGLSFSPPALQSGDGRGLFLKAEAPLYLLDRAFPEAESKGSSPSGAFLRFCGMDFQPVLRFARGETTCPRPAAISCKQPS